MSGWFALKRGMLDHPIFAPRGKYSRAEAWIWLIENACFKATVVELKGQKHRVPRGAMVFSLRFLASKWGWSIKAVRVFLGTLEETETIKKEVILGAHPGAHLGAQLTLCNYEKYQAAGHDEGHTKGHKEEQEIPKPKGLGHGDADADADAENDFDPLKIVFDQGVRFMGTRNIPERQARAVIGRWRKGHQVDDIAKAISSAARESAVDPISYIQACLGQAKKKADLPKDGDTRIGPNGENQVFDGFNGWMVERW